MSKPGFVWLDQQSMVLTTVHMIQGSKSWLILIMLHVELWCFKPDLCRLVSEKDTKWVHVIGLAKMDEQINQKTQWW